jgi:hypothetical protein
MGWGFVLEAEKPWPWLTAEKVREAVGVVFAVVGEVGRGKRKKKRVREGGSGGSVMGLAEGVGIGWLFIFLAECD